MRHVPNVLTALGLVAGLLGLGMWPSTPAIVLLGLSLVLDVADGHAARELGAVTPWGAELDWCSDVALSHAIAWRCLPPAGAAWASVTLVMIQSMRGELLRLISGRAAVFALSAAAWALR